jgi:hypothetical protein
MQIIINQGYRRYLLKVDLIHKDEICERYKVYPPEDPTKYIILENNRPLIRGKYKLKKRRIDWKQTAGRTMSVKTRAEIEKIIESPPAPDKPVEFGKPISKKRNKNYKGPPLSDRKKPD